MMNSQFNKLLSKARTTEDGCMEWIASKNSHGYGKVANGIGGWSLAHRVAWEVTNGAIPLGMEVCHRCDNRACINPDHLFLGTHAENIADCKNKGRAKGLAGEANPRNKISLSAALEIKASKGPRKELAKKYGVSVHLISRIRAGYAWAHIQTEAMVGE